MNGKLILKRGAILLSALALTATATGCRKSVEDGKSRQAEALYRDLYALAKSYTDSIAKAPDSAQVGILAERFETRISKINSNYPPETDYAMTEQENDTLKSLLDRYVVVRDSRLKKLHLASDTIKPDSHPDLSADKE